MNYEEAFVNGIRIKERMKCYVCGHTIIKSVRVEMPPKDKRYKHGFRDLCDACYRQNMEKKGYEYKNGIYFYKAGNK